MTFNRLHELRLDGDNVSADVANACTALGWDLTINGASTLRMTLHDGKRKLIRSGFLDEKRTATIDGVGFTLVQRSKRGDSIELTFEDIAVNALRQHDEPLKVGPGQLSRVEFARRLLEEEPWIILNAPENADKTKVELSRGTPASAGSEEARETSWDALGRIFSEVRWRRWALGDTLYLARDEDLLVRPATYIFREHRDGVDEIDFDTDEGKRVWTATVRARAPRFGVRPGDTALIDGLGSLVLDKWIVAEVRTPDAFSPAVEIELVRPTKSLPEPDPPPEPDVLPAGAGGAPGYGAGFIVGGGVSARGLMFPVPGGRVISEWGACRSGLSCSGPCCRRHKGWDIAAPRGTPIVSPADGVVARVVTGTAGYGNAVYITHSHLGLQTVHAHCQTITVARGQAVRQGQQVATVGDTGNARGTTPHNHTEVRVGGSPVNPAGYYTRG